ncbi:MAG: AmmeMemoRadiSam system protein B [Methanobacteriaceae archaeon]|nr:AmmeMemoRadiSam system protein B [Methanobacteriaceae archaeon]
MIRKPAVAGTFYEGTRESLKKRIEWCFKHKMGPGVIPDKIGNKRSIKGVLAPHAGYAASGPVAAHTYYKLVEDGFPETFVILCPNHYGIGSGVSAMTSGEWETPLGNVEIDQEFAQQLIQNSDIIDSESSAHLREHSCEIQIPFLQYFKEDFKIVPVSMWMQDVETSHDIGIAIKETVETLGRDTVVIASSDFTHYEPQKAAYTKDRQVLDAIAQLDEKLMVKRVFELNVTMCGPGPVAATIVASKGLGAQNSEIIKYGTSGDVIGDKREVVGYASAIFW